ncbi:MAG TPA: TlyA family RNA methyltransferase [Microbacteriaceae bacterium]|nr:TlyA family RNA methyltransferase [Microbacteriaceae bacterium]
MTERLDAALAARGVARSRTHAQQLIANGVVFVNGRNVRKASLTVSETDELRVDGLHHYVSRAALKLLAGLDAFDLTVQGALALDVGASTGGFTQVLLERGARHVIALDVGRAQIAPSLRSDERVTVLEGVNIREVSPERLASLSGVSEKPTVVVGDLSFISLELVLPGLATLAADDAQLVLLIKPQFEVGRGGVREGIVRDSAARAEAVERVLWAAFDAGLRIAGLERSPLLGGHGNVEVLAWLSRTIGTTPTEWSHRIREVTA